MFIGVVSIWMVAVITPGPNFFITARTAMAGGRQSAFFVVIGICTGTLIWGTAGFSGLSFLYSISPAVYKILRIAGGLYISYLGITFLIKALKSNTQVDISGRSDSSAARCWWLGTLTI